MHNPRTWILRSWLVKATVPTAKLSGMCRCMCGCLPASNEAALAPSSLTNAFPASVGANGKDQTTAGTKQSLQIVTTAAARVPNQAFIPTKSSASLCRADEMSSEVRR